MKKKKLLLLLMPLITLILEILPYGVILKFATPPGEPPIITKTSYFDLLPLGYANIAPLLTAIMTCALLLVIIGYMIKACHKLLKAGKIISVIAFVLSFGPLIFSSYSWIGGLISASLFAEFLLLSHSNSSVEENKQI